MKLNDLLTTLRTIDFERVEIRDSNNNEMFTCPANSETLLSYKDYIVIEWFPRGATDKGVTFTVLIMK